MHKFLLKILIFSTITFNIFADMNPIIPQLIPDSSLVGKGKYTFLFMKIFDIELYAPQGKFDKNQPYALELDYHRNLKGKSIAEKTIEKISEQSTKVSSEQLNSWQQQLTTILPDVKQGSSLIGVYTPSIKQTKFFNNEQVLLGSIDGEDFANHFFGIWIGEDSSEPQLRKSLLGINS
jgi:hypothetical protein